MLYDTFVETFKKHGHDIADARWREVQAGNLGQGARADRLPVRDIAFDEGFEQGLGALIELHGGVRLGSAYYAR